MSETVIRRAEPADQADLCRLLASQLDEHHIRLDAARLANAVGGVLDVPARGFFLVARDGRLAVGAAYVSFIWALEHGGHAGWLEELYVVPARRESGLGTRLLEAAMDEARNAGCAALDLEIDADHERVRSLYQRHGFTTLPRSRVVRRL
jgi:GNAT superfamily N-acetyltransferase